MKTILTTVSLVALGAASGHAIYAPELSRLETTKPWTVSASLRGFWDDNRNNAPNWSAARQSSFGFEARPYVGFNFPMAQTFVGFSYLNSSRWYEHYDSQNQDGWDFDHEFMLKLTHQFSPRYRLRVNDDFLYGVRPEVEGVVTTYRSDTSYLRNMGVINFMGELTPTFGFSLSYNNNYYNYTDDSYPGSLSARLDRFEHLIPVDLRYQVQPDLVAMLGYQLGIFDYIGDSFVDPIGLYPSSSRNFMSHTLYLGADYDITAQWQVALRAGASYADYDSFPEASGWNPYVDATVSYNYTVGSHATLGFKYLLAATDQYAPAGGMPVLSQQVAVPYLHIQHQFTPKLTGNILLQYQMCSFNGGYLDGMNENFLLLSVYAGYRLSQYFSLEAGYHFDLLDSDYGAPYDRSYDRNYVYLGVRAQY